MDGRSEGSDYSIDWMGCNGMQEERREKKIVNENGNQLPYHVARHRQAFLLLLSLRGSASHYSSAACGVDVKL